METWHHYCVTYAAEEHPKEKDRYLPGNVTLYVDGRKEGFWKNATVNTSLGSPLYIGADIKGSKTLDGAVDEVYVYDKALDAWQVEVLHGILSPPPTAGPSAAPTPVPSPLPSVSPTLTSAPTDHEYQDNLVAYYPMTHGKLDDAHASEFHGKAWRPEQPLPDQNGCRGSAADRGARRSRGRRGGAQQQQVHQAAGQRDEVHLRGPAEDGLPLGADRQVEERPDLRVRQKGAPGRAVRPAHLERPGRVCGRSAMERSEPLGQSKRQPEHERQHGWRRRHADTDSDSGSNQPTEFCEPGMSLPT